MKDKEGEGLYTETLYQGSKYGQGRKHTFSIRHEFILEAE